MVPPTAASPKSPGLLDSWTPAGWGTGMVGEPFREAVRKKTQGTLLTWWGGGGSSAKCFSSNKKEKQ